MKIITCGILLCLTILSAIAQVKKPTRPAIRPPFSESLQALVVATKNWDAVQGTARLYERKTASSQWKPAGESFLVVVGRSGLGLDDDINHDLWGTPSSYTKPVAKREGDGRSPAGLFPLTFAFGSKTTPVTKLPYTDLKEFTECVDDVNSNHYNTIVDRMQVGAYDWKSSEKMLAVGEAYERGVFVAYNSYPPQKGAGSCIFLHIWKDENTGTSGCTAMKRSDLESLLTHLDPAKTPYLVQMPLDTYRSQQKSWKLPKLK
ncbi:MAG: L,D-transpeptidase family protein [Acidobacteriota bacterium]